MLHLSLIRFCFINWIQRLIIFDASSTKLCESYEKVSVSRFCVDTNLQRIRLKESYQTIKYQRIDESDVSENHETISDFITCTFIMFSFFSSPILVFARKRFPLLPGVTLLQIRFLSRTNTFKGSSRRLEEHRSKSVKVCFFHPDDMNRLTSLLSAEFPLDESDAILCKSITVHEICKRFYSIKLIRLSTCRRSNLHFPNLKTDSKCYAKKEGKQLTASMQNRANIFALLGINHKRLCRLIECHKKTIFCLAL